MRKRLYKRKMKIDGIQRETEIEIEMEILLMRNYSNVEIESVFLFGWYLENHFSLGIELQTCV